MTCQDPSAPPSSSPRSSDGGLVQLEVAPPLVPPQVETGGMRARRRNFGSQVEFYAPDLKRWQTSEWKPERASRFVAVSVTGTACALSCDHCETRVLEGMIDVGSGESLFETARRLKSRGTEGILISGGSTKTGEVPLKPHMADMSRVKEELGLKVIVHSGVVSPELAAGLAKAGVDGVMLDVIGADETVREVYHLDLGAADMERSIELLASQGLNIMPHIVLGLHYGRFLGEWKALEMVQRYPVSTLILVVLTPLVGTPMADLEPPRTRDVASFFADAREALPRTQINLGCGRPMGAQKVALDKAAVDHGLNGIAYPAEGIIDYARECGLEPRFFEYCCSLTWAHA